MIPENTIIIPKTEHPITGDYRADRLIEYVRKNGFPKWDTQPIMFANEKVYALCSELSIEEHIMTLECMQMGLCDDDETILFFDGGMCLIEPDEQYYIAVDDHLYFFDF